MILAATLSAIAAVGLAKRMRSLFGPVFGLRMGHGHKEETRGVTRVWYVTTGHLLLTSAFP